MVSPRVHAPRENEQHPIASQVLKLGGQPISLQFGPRAYVDGPSGGPERGLRFNTVRLFPQ